MSNDIDYSTNKVIDWVSSLGHSFIRINSENVLSHSSKTDLRLGNEGISVRFNKSSEEDEPGPQAVWFRKDQTYTFPPAISSEIANDRFREVVNKNLASEFLNAKGGLYGLLGDTKTVLGNCKKMRVNKLETLWIAKNCGFNIPDTLLTSIKSDVEAFMTTHGHLITKSVGENDPLFINENDYFVNYTEEITEQNIANMPDHFYYSLFQEKLDKDIEVRVFYLNGSCYSMAIFSQSSAQTQIDLRKYNNNRNVPYLLPYELNNNIVKFMNTMELNTGSLDIVKTKSGKYYFLEVNPTGQYDMMSVRCNYNLDKKIAEYLIN